MSVATTQPIKPPTAGTRKTVHDVVVIGAGPHGLSVAAHLRHAGVETRVFGEVMSFWQAHMPEGMLLRSSWRSSHISDPERALTLDRYESICGVKIPRPIPLPDYVEYGRWFQRAVLPDLDPRRIVRIEPVTEGFCLITEDGEPIRARRVVVAAGISEFARRPPPFDELPDSLVSHAVDHRDFRRFAGRHVAVVGSGQSALESAALLVEAGADVEILVRAAGIRWIREGGRSQAGRFGKLMHRVLYPPTEVGPRGLNWIVASPDLFRRLPDTTQPFVSERVLLPVGASWLAPRLANVPVTTSASVASAVSFRGRVKLVLETGATREFQHVVLGTGYQVDVRGYAFLATELQHVLRLSDGYPVMSAGLESSIPGLHFVGAPAAHTFGPVMRFVVGTAYCGRALTRRVRGLPPALVSFSW